jgi:ferredoxin
MARRDRVTAGATEFEVVVDKAKCCGYGICAEICSDVYKLDAQGFVYIDGPVPARLADAAREGAEACPEEALTVLEAR